MKTSSTSIVNQQLNQLSKMIYNIEAKPDLYLKTLQKIKERQNISMLWTRLIACSFILLIGIEWYLIHNTYTTTKEISLLQIEETNNILYHE